jgi:ankyrin repeat protein
VAFSGHPAQNFASLSRAFRGDEMLWGCIKDRRGPNGATCLMASARSGDLVRVRWLLDRGANVEAARTDSGSTSLILASQEGHLEVVRELLGWGANASAAQTSDGTSSLMSACENGHLEIVRELLVRGANVNAADTEYGCTSLMFATYAGHLGIVRVLLGSGANVNAVNDDLESSLMISCKSGDLPLVIVLIQNQANKYLESHIGLRALDLTPKEYFHVRALLL